MRLFLAVPLSDPVVAAITKAVGGMGLTHPPGKWVEPANMHLTLKFLGETPENHIDNVAASAEAACSGHRGFAIRLGHLGAFPDLSRPRVLFYRLEEGAKKLEALAVDLDEALAQRLGTARETRPFRAHITIARITSALTPPIIDALSAAPPVVGGRQTVDSVHLIRSELSRKGPKYYHLKEFALAKSKC